MWLIREGSPLCALSQSAGMGLIENLHPLGIFAVPIYLEAIRGGYIARIEEDMSGLLRLGVGDDRAWVGAAMSVKLCLLDIGA